MLVIKNSKYKYAWYALTVAVMIIFCFFICLAIAAIFVFKDGGMYALDKNYLIGRLPPRSLYRRPVQTTMPPPSSGFIKKDGDINEYAVWGDFTIIHTDEGWQGFNRKQNNFTQDYNTFEELETHLGISKTGLPPSWVMRADEDVNEFAILDDFIIVHTGEGWYGVNRKQHNVTQRYNTLEELETHLGISKTEVKLVKSLPLWKLMNFHYIPISFVVVGIISLCIFWGIRVETHTKK